MLFDFFSRKAVRTLEIIPTIIVGTIIKKLKNQFTSPKAATPSPPLEAKFKNRRFDNKLLTAITNDIYITQIKKIVKKDLREVT